MAKKRKVRTLDAAYIAIGAALIAVCSWISIPWTVPFTMQTFGVFFVLLLLGGIRGTLSIVVYILLGIVGAPVFSGFAGGVGVILGKTGGYILGFVLTGLIYLIIVEVFGNKTGVRLAALALGLLACYAGGTAWFMYIYLRDVGAVGVMTVLSWCVFPFILPDVVKMGLAYVVAKRVKPVLKE